MKHQVKRLGVRAKVGEIMDKNGTIIGTGMNQYALRHFASTELARRRVPKEERDLFAGHKGEGSDMGA
jgi:hypothetical protein